MAQRKESKFRLNAKNLFATYPKCNLDKNRVIDILWERLEKYHPESYVGAREEHKDGTPHIHVLICCGAKFNIRDERYFDVEGFHGNYCSTTSVRSTRAYIKKGMDWVEKWEDFPTEDNFCKKKRDLEAWTMYRTKKELGCPFPFRLPWVNRIVE